MADNSCISEDKNARSIFRKGLNYNDVFGMSNPIIILCKNWPPGF